VKVYAVAKGPAKVSEFEARLTSGHVLCALTGGDQLLCEGVPHTSGGGAPPVQVAKLRRDGVLTTCTQQPTDRVCFEGDFGAPIPSFRPGRHIRVGPFACTVLKTGVRCTVAATGRGFRITPTAVIPVIPAAPG
jgi:hypothetical protein